MEYAIPQQRKGKKEKKKKRKQRVYKKGGKYRASKVKGG